MSKHIKRNILIISAAITALLFAFAPDRKAGEPEKPQIETEKAQIETEKAQIETQSTIRQPEHYAIAAAPVETIYFEVPLSHELQDFIFAECEAYNIAPEIVIAMIQQESNFKADAIGDNGNSYGLMQIQPKWHQERMDRLGCNDLLNPYQNIKVGINIIVELREYNAELLWVLMAYNGGQAHADERIISGNISDYALQVIEKARELTFEE